MDVHASVPGDDLGLGRDAEGMARPEAGHLGPGVEVEWVEHRGDLRVRDAVLFADARGLPRGRHDEAAGAAEAVRPSVGLEPAHVPRPALERRENREVQRAAHCHGHVEPRGLVLLHDQGVDVFPAQHTAKREGRESDVRGHVAEPLPDDSGDPGVRWERVLQFRRVGVLDRASQEAVGPGERECPHRRAGGPVLEPLRLADLPGHTHHDCPDADPPEGLGVPEQPPAGHLRRERLDGDAEGFEEVLDGVAPDEDGDGWGVVGEGPHRADASAQASRSYWTQAAKWSRTRPRTSGISSTRLWSSSGSVVRSYASMLSREAL